MTDINGQLTEIGGCAACSAQVGGNSCSVQRGGVRKLSAYTQFMKTEMKKMKATHPNKKASELMKMVARKWNEVKPKATKASKSSSKSGSVSTRKTVRKTGKK
jgi:Tfp pilus assembly protein PilP